MENPAGLSTPFEWASGRSQLGYMDELWPIHLLLAFDEMTYLSELRRSPFDADQKTASFLAATNS
jgi:hypothetical protein